MSVKLEINNKNIKAKAAEKLNIPKMRTIKDTIATVYAMDPNSSLTEHHLRVLIRTDEFKEKGIVKFAGKKAMINIDKFFEFLAS